MTDAVGRSEFCGACKFLRSLEKVKKTADTRVGMGCRPVMRAGTTLLKCIGAV